MSEKKEKLVHCKYLEDVGIDVYDMPQNFCKETVNSRVEKWEKEREKYGFDERETWSLDDSLLQWLYSRLMMYKDINNVAMDKVSIKCEAYKEKHGSADMTQEDLLKYLLEDLETALRTDSYDPDPEVHKVYAEAFGRALMALGEDANIEAFWW